MESSGTVFEFERLVPPLFGNCRWGVGTPGMALSGRCGGPLSGGAIQMRWGGGGRLFRALGKSTPEQIGGQSERDRQRNPFPPFQAGTRAGRGSDPDRPEMYVGVTAVIAIRVHQARVPTLPFRLKWPGPTSATHTPAVDDSAPVSHGRDNHGTRSDRATHRNRAIRSRATGPHDPACANDGACLSWREGSREGQGAEAEDRIFHLVVPFGTEGEMDFGRPARSPSERIRTCRAAARRPDWCSIAA